MAISNNFTVNLLSVILIVPTIGQAATIYKVTDTSSGHITFTDRPDDYQAGRRYQVSVAQIRSAPSGQPTQQPKPMGVGEWNKSDLGDQSALSESVPLNVVPVRPSNPKSAFAPRPRPDYQLQLVAPHQDQLYRRPAQNINIKLATARSIRPTDKLVVYLDAKKVAQSLTATLSTTKLLPGSHEISAVIISSNGEILDKVSRRVYIIQNSRNNTRRLSQQRQRAQQLKVNQQLPWYQKLRLKLRQNEPD